MVACVALWLWVWVIWYSEGTAGVQEGQVGANWSCDCGCMCACSEDMAVGYLY